MFGCVKIILLFRLSTFSSTSYLLPSSPRLLLPLPPLLLIICFPFLLFSSSYYSSFSTPSPLPTLFLLIFSSSSSPPRDKQQISILARKVIPGRPHGYLMLELKPVTDYQRTLKTNVLPGENDVLQSNLIKYIQKQSYRQPPILNVVHVQHATPN